MVNVSISIRLININFILNYIFNTALKNSSSVSTI